MFQLRNRDEKAENNETEKEVRQVMSETICPKCSASSPEQALYCQACSQPLVCRNCQAPLLPTAGACIRCGLLIPERSHTAVQMTSAPLDIADLRYMRLLIFVRSISSLRMRQWSM